MLPACVSVKEKSCNDDGKYGTVLFSPGWTGTVSHQTTQMSSAQFTAGHVFYQHFPLLFSCFSYNNTFILAIKIVFLEYIQV